MDALTEDGGACEVDLIALEKRAHDVVPALGSDKQTVCVADEHERARARQTHQPHRDSTKPSISLPASHVHPGRPERRCPQRLPLHRAGTATCARLLGLMVRALHRRRARLRRPREAVSRRLVWQGRCGRSCRRRAGLRTFVPRTSSGTDTCSRASQRCPPLSLYVEGPVRAAADSVRSRAGKWSRRSRARTPLRSRRQ